MYEKILCGGGGGGVDSHPCLNKTLNNTVLLGLSPNPAAASLETNDKLAPGSHNVARSIIGVYFTNHQYNLS